MEKNANATHAIMSGMRTVKVTRGVPGTCARVSTSMMRPNRMGSAKAEMAKATLASASRPPILQVGAKLTEDANVEADQPHMSGPQIGPREVAEAAHDSIEHSGETPIVHL